MDTNFIDQRNWGEAKPFAPAVSTSFWGMGHLPTLEQLSEARSLGFEWVEVAMNPLRFGYTEEKVEERIATLNERLEQSGLRCWSVHLPFNRDQLDISSTDCRARIGAMELIERYISLSDRLHPMRLVLHPSSEPIDEEQRSERLRLSRLSIGGLRWAAANIGAMLCIEDLPRTCLGNTAEEIACLVEGYDNVGVCFDTNHLLTQHESHFIELLGQRICTIHVSDYNHREECHWVPGQGDIDWAAMKRMLQRCGYRGPLVMEVFRNSDGSKVNIGQIADFNALFATLGQG